MKRKRPVQEERRRPLIEFDLISDGRGRLAARRRGCLGFATIIFLSLVAAGYLRLA